MEYQAAVYGADDDAAFVAFVGRFVFAGFVVFVFFAAVREFAVGGFGLDACAADADAALGFEFGGWGDRQFANGFGEGVVF